MAVKKASKKKALKEGIVLRRSAKGFSVHISSNGRKLAVMTGYNTRANAMKGMLAVNRILNAHYNEMDNFGWYRITDLTKPAKKAVKKAKKK